MGFKATEEVEELSYDFRPYSDENGVIGEPSTDQVKTYRESVFAAVEGSGLDPAELATGTVDFDKLGELSGKAGALEEVMLSCTADLTGLPLVSLQALPYRLSRAFMGWIMGQFFNPEG